MRRTLAKARRDNVLLGSLLVMTLIGVAGGGVNLLVPLQLRADGLSAGATGLAMSGSAVVFLLSSALIAGRARAVSLRVVAIAALLYGGSMLLAAGDTSAATMIAFVLLRSPFWAALSTLAYPLAALGAVRAAVGRGAVNGLLNLAWGAAGSAGPVMAGALAQAVGRPWVFAALAAACSGVGVSLLATDSTARPLQRELRSAPANPCCEKGRW